MLIPNLGVYIPIAFTSLSKRMDANSQLAACFVAADDQSIKEDGC